MNLLEMPPATRLTGDERARIEVVCERLGRVQTAETLGLSYITLQRVMRAECACNRAVVARVRAKLDQLAPRANRREGAAQ
jgi:hypothetical protein